MCSSLKAVIHEAVLVPLGCRHVLCKLFFCSSCHMWHDLLCDPVGYAWIYSAVTPCCIWRKTICYDAVRPAYLRFYCYDVVVYDAKLFIVMLSYLLKFVLEFVLLWRCIWHKNIRWDVALYTSIGPAVTPTCIMQHASLRRCLVYSECTKHGSLQCDLCDFVKFTMRGSLHRVLCKFVKFTKYT